MKKRRQWTTYSGSGKRVAPRTRTSRVSRGKEMGVPRLWVQLIVCGALFVALIGLKLLMPGNLSALRGTLGQWLVRDADFIFRDEIAKAHLEQTMNQYFAVLTNMRSVGGMGDGRTYDYTLALRSVTTTDFMTANWTRIPYDVLDRVSVRIVNEVKGINRIVYDITSKPPATIEWE